MSPHRFFWQVFLWLVFFLLAASFLFGIVLYRHMAETTLASLKDHLRDETETLSAMAEASPEIMNLPGKIVHSVPGEDRATIISPTGVVLADNWAEIMHKEVLENHSSRPEVKAALAGAPIFIQRFSTSIDREILYYAVPVHDESGKTAFVLRLSFALTTYQERLTPVRNFLIGAALLSILFSLPLAYFVSLANTRQIERLRMAANRVAAGDLPYRIEEKGSLEFRELAADFNKMADQLNQKILSIQHQHTQTETLLSRMVEGVLAVDHNGKAVFSNDAFARMFGLKEERIQGKSMLEMIRNDQLADFITTLLRDPSASPIQGNPDHFDRWRKNLPVQSSRILEDANAGAAAAPCFP